MVLNSRRQFRDGIALRYTWEAKNTPAICPCGKDFSLTHALHCAKGGYTHLRHNEIRDVFANLMDDVCHDVQIEPKLQTLDGKICSSNCTTTDDDARLDIKANGLWGSRFNRTFFDVKICNPHAKSCPKTIKDTYKYYESIKRNKYEERIRETERSSFNALSFACSGGAGPSASRVMKQLATKIRENRGEPYADSISYIRMKISFAILRSCVLCLRECCALKPRVLSESSISTVVEEGRLHWVFGCFTLFLCPFLDILFLFQSFLTSSFCVPFIWIGAFLSTCLLFLWLGRLYTVWRGTAWSAASG